MSIIIIITSNNVNWLSDVDHSNLTYNVKAILAHGNSNSNSRST